MKNVIILLVDKLSRGRLYQASMTSLCPFVLCLHYRLSRWICGVLLSGTNCKASVTLLLPNLTESLRRSKFPTKQDVIVILNCDLPSNIYKDGWACNVVREEGVKGGWDWESCRPCRILTWLGQVFSVARTESLDTRRSGAAGVGPHFDDVGL